MSFLVAAGCWGLFAVWIVYEMIAAPVIEEPIEAFWLCGIDPGSLQDMDDSEEDDFARDLDQLQRLRTFDLTEWQ